MPLRMGPEVPRVDTRRSFLTHEGDTILYPDAFCVTSVRPSIQEVPDRRARAVTARHT